MKYPIGIQNFEKIRTEGYVYVDKTALMYKMVSEGSYYFLSRPRRFGKSLLVSTLEAYFEGKCHLFDGLAISEKETEWLQYPILHLDLNTREYKDGDSLRAELHKHLEAWEKQYGDEFCKRALEERFVHIIELAYAKTGRPVVVLVDEYDKPLLQAIGNDKLQAEYRSTLKAFYGALKSCDKYIKFAFLTGVTKFGKVSVFSDLNNLIDLSMLPQYTTICGVSEEELHHNFDDSISALANANAITIEECYKKLRTDFDGYHFDVDSPGMYNPFSLLNTLSFQVFRDYWFETGTPSFLVRQLQKTDYPLDMMTEEELTADTLNSIDMMDDNPLPLLYQSGYLTIKGYDKEFATYKLDFPNREVREGFIKYLLPFYTPKNREKPLVFIRNFVNDIRIGNPDGFMQRMQALFARGDYQVMGDKEIYFQNAMYVIFMMLGFYVDVERHTSNGRMDITIQTDIFIYILELKINQSADIALQQIENRGYAQSFVGDQRNIYLIGVNFSTETKQIDDWKVKQGHSRFTR